MFASPTDRYRRVDAVFDALLDVPPDEQMAFAERAAGDDPEVHAEVLRLLHAHRREGFLESPPPMAGALLDAAAAPRAPRPSASARGASSGCSAGAAWATVYLGERADGQFEQRAAVKLIQRAAPGMLRRFLEERRILALLEHPGIARLLEGGVTADGLPYFAMELVEGVPLTRYCDEHELSVARRLELVGAGLRRGELRPPAPRHPPRSQAVEHPGDGRRPAQAARLRHREAALRRRSARSGPRPSSRR